MKKKAAHLLLILIIFLIAFSGEQEKINDFQVHKGLYFGQEPPGERAELFAPGIITFEVHASPTISPDGKEMFMDSMEEGCLYYKMIDNTWTLQPEMPFTLPGLCNGVFISPSGNSLYFLAWKNNEEIFYISKKKAGEWSELKSLGEEVNSFKTHWQFSSARNENLYFSFEGNLMVSLYDGNQHLKPVSLIVGNDEKLKGVTPFIAPDESYIIYSCSFEKKEADLHISYRLENNTWTKPTNLGPSINIEDNLDLCPKVSPDGKFLFFISRRPGPDFGLYWVSAKIIKDLCPKKTILGKN